MLDDPSFSYDRIARRFGITRQRVGEIAAQVGIDGRRCQSERAAEAFLATKTKRRYSPTVRAVVARSKAQNAPRCLPPDRQPHFPERVFKVLHCPK